MTDLADDPALPETDVLVARWRAAAERAATSPEREERPPAPVDEEVRAAQQAQRAESWARLVPPVYDDPTLAKYAHGSDRYPPALAAVVDGLRAWATDPTRNLVILGPVGTGKSYAAWAALRRAYGLGHSVHGTGTVALLDALRPGGPPDQATRARDVDLLLLDDVGAQRDTDWTDERLYALVHYRWEQRRPIVLTTNLDVTGLRKVLGARPYSRIVDDALVLHLAGRDLRRPHAQA